MAVVEPPALERVPVDSNGLIGVAPPSRTRMNSVLSLEYTLVKLRDELDAVVSM